MAAAQSVPRTIGVTFSLPDQAVSSVLGPEESVRRQSIIATALAFCSALWAVAVRDPGVAIVKSYALPGAIVCSDPDGDHMTSEHA